jgi:hypothetical protein
MVLNSYYINEIEKSRTIGAKDKQKRKERGHKIYSDAKKEYQIDSINDLFPKEKMTEHDVLVKEIKPNMVDKYTYENNNEKVQSGWIIKMVNKNGKEFTAIDGNTPPLYKKGQVGLLDLGPSNIPKLHYYGTKQTGGYLSPLDR